MSDQYNKKWNITFEKCQMGTSITAKSHDFFMQNTFVRNDLFLVTVSVSTNHTFLIREFIYCWNPLAFFMLQWYLKDNYHSLLLWSWVTHSNEQPLENHVLCLPSMSSFHHIMALNSLCKLMNIIIHDSVLLW